MAIAGYCAHCADPLTAEEIEAGYCPGCDRILGENDVVIDDPTLDPGWDTGEFIDEPFPTHPITDEQIERELDTTPPDAPNGWTDQLAS